MRQLLSDARFAVAALRRQPGFAAVVVATLALGIGANTTLFSIVDAVLLRPLPFRSPDRLVTIWETGARKARVAPANFLDWRAEAKSFSAMAGFNAAGFTLIGAGEPERIGGASVSVNYFDVLGVKAVAGRTFAPRDAEAGALSVVLGFDLWKGRFGADPKVIGRTILLDGQPYTVIGVAPPGLFPSWPSATARISFAARTQQVFVPMRMNAERAANRNSHVMGVLARLRDGIAIADADDEMKALHARLAVQYPATNAGESALVSSLESEITGDVRPALIVLLAAVGLLLILACANAASILLARATSREREIAVRRALGASRVSIARLLVTESLLLAISGGFAGCALAALGLPLLVSILPQDLPRLTTVVVNGRVLAFALLASIATGLAFGWWPAIRASAADPAKGLRDGAPGSGDHRGHRVRRGLVVAQVAMALVLVTCGALLTRSFERLRQVDPGFRPEGVLAFQLVLPARYSATPEVSAGYNELLSRLRGLPGVLTGAVAYDSPLESNWIDSFSIEGKDDSGEGGAHLAIVSPSYFETLDVRLLSGRPIDERDSQGSSGAVVVSRDFASRYFPNDDALGHWLRLGSVSGMGGAAAPVRFQIVGVAENVHSLGVAKASEPTYYVSSNQFPQRDMSILLRVAGDAMALLPSVRSEVRRFDDSIALLEPTTLARTLDSKVAQPRFNMLTLAGFASLAVALTAVGLYGLLSYSVARRTREIGVRLTLGARPEQVRSLIVGEGLRLVALGGAIGLVVALAASQLMAALLFGIPPRDAVSFAAGTLTLLIVGAAAAYIPARRASKVAPGPALRGD
jgi:predicted permease